MLSLIRGLFIVNIKEVFNHFWYSTILYLRGDVYFYLLIQKSIILMDPQKSIAAKIFLLS